jgi:hypothetical protein
MWLKYTSVSKTVSVSMGVFGIRTLMMQMESSLSKTGNPNHCRVWL